MGVCGRFMGAKNEWLKSTGFTQSRKGSKGAKGGFSLRLCVKRLH